MGHAGRGDIFLPAGVDAQMGTGSSSREGQQRAYPGFAPILLILPVAALVAALLAGSVLLLDYVHVITGGMWTGIDIFMFIFGRGVMRLLSPPARVEVSRRIVPMFLFLMPALASVAITAGYLLAVDTGRWVLTSPYIIAAGIVTAILTVQGFGMLLPNEVRVLMELRKKEPDAGKIVRLSMKNFSLSGSQALFQIVIIFIMANLRFY